MLINVSTVWRVYPRVCVLVLGLVWLLPATASGGESALQVLDQLVGRWMDLRGSLATERREWSEQRVQWEQEAELLSREAALLAEDLDNIRGVTAGLDAEHERLQERLTRLRSILKRLEPGIERAEANLRAWEQRVPAGLCGVLRPGWTELPADAALARQLPLAERAQVVVGLYAQIEELQNSIHVTRELLETGSESGQVRQVEVIYLGLARAFAVSPNTEWAAVGTPTGEGWQWRLEPALAGAVKSAIQVFRREIPAGMQSLPMQIVQPEGGE